MTVGKFTALNILILSLIFGVIITLCIPVILEYIGIHELSGAAAASCIYEPGSQIAATGYPVPFATTTINKQVRCNEFLLYNNIIYSSFLSDWIFWTIIIGLIVLTIGSAVVGNKLKSKGPTQYFIYSISTLIGTYIGIAPFFLTFFYITIPPISLVTIIIGPIIAFLFALKYTKNWKKAIKPSILSFIIIIALILLGFFGVYG